MDPISAAIIAGLAAGATQAVSGALVDAYSGLKALLIRKFGSDSEVVKKVSDLEAKPDSDGRRTSLQEEVVAVGGDQDSELLQAAQDLLDAVRTQPAGDQYIQNVSGSGGAAMTGGVAAGSGGVAIGGTVHGGVRGPIGGRNVAPGPVRADAGPSKEEGEEDAPA